MVHLRRDRGAPGRQGRRRSPRAARRLPLPLGARLPSAVACLVEDFGPLTVHLRFPTEHWERCRHANLTERTFGETRRRTKVMGRLPGGHTCAALVFAVLDPPEPRLASHDDVAESTSRLQDLRRQLFGPPAAIVVDVAVTTAAQHHIGACVRSRLHRAWEATTPAGHWRRAMSSSPGRRAAKRVNGRLLLGAAKDLGLANVPGGELLERTAPLALELDPHLPARIGRWWDMVGSRAHPKAKRLLVTTDAGGPNGYRVRL